MPVDFSKLDSLRMGELATALESETVQSAGSILAEIRRRLAMNGGHIPGVSISLGDVGRLEWTELLRAGRCYALTFAIAADVTHVSCAYIGNPVNSGKRALVFGWTIGTGAVEFIVGSRTQTVTGPTGFSSCINLNSGAAFQAAPQKIITGADNTVIISAGAERFRSGFADTKHNLILTDGSQPLIELAEGRDLVFAPAAINTAMNGTVYFAEVDSGYPT